MTRAEGLKSRIQRSKKNHDRSPRPAVKNLSKCPSGRANVHVREHLPILHKIESTILRCYSDDDRIDDVVVMSVLQSLVLQDPPGMLPHAWLYSELIVARNVVPEVNPELDDLTWIECLRMVMDSIRRHSHLHQGERNYLETTVVIVAA